MHPAAAVAFDLATTPRNPADLMTSSRHAWNQHRYFVTYATFRAFYAYGEAYVGEAPEGHVNALQMPYPGDQELALLGSVGRGRQVVDAIAEYTLDTTTAFITGERPGGPTLEELDRRFKGNVAFVFAFWTSQGLMSAAAEGRDPEPMLASVRETLEGLGRS